MSRPFCQEDGYEYRVKRIFARLREIQKACESSMPFEEWIESPRSSYHIANVFIDDVVTYMGIPEADDEE